MEIHGDCLEVLPDFEEDSFDFIVVDPPYGKTEVKWDSIIPIDEMWKLSKRVLRPNKTMVVFATHPFAANLICSNFDMFKYEWIWKKNTTSLMVHAKNRPMRKHENILVFSEGAIAHKHMSNRRMPYFPQDLKPFQKTMKLSRKGGIEGHRPNQDGKMYTQKFTNFPNTILEYNTVNRSKRLNSTQKPVNLIEYLIRTYTEEGERVLDFAAGSGTAAIAAIKSDRDYVVLEKDDEMYEKMVDRIEKYKKYGKDIGE